MTLQVSVTTTSFQIQIKAWHQDISTHCDTGWQHIFYRSVQHRPMQAKTKTKVLIASLLLVRCRQKRRSWSDRGRHHVLRSPGWDRQWLELMITYCIYFSNIVVITNTKQAYVCMYVCMYVCIVLIQSTRPIRKKQKMHSRQMDRQTKANYIYKQQANQKTHKNL